jgi:hypothetical protein
MPSGSAAVVVRARCGPSQGGVACTSNGTQSSDPSPAGLSLTSTTTVAVPDWASDWVQEASTAAEPSADGAIAASLAAGAVRSS